MGRSEREGTVRRGDVRLHGSDYRPISTPHRSGIQMKKKIAMHFVFTAVKPLASSYVCVLIQCYVHKNNLL